MLSRRSAQGASSRRNGSTRPGSLWCSATLPSVRLPEPFSSRLSRANKKSLREELGGGCEVLGCGVGGNPRYRSSTSSPIPSTSPLLPCSPRTRFFYLHAFRMITLKKPDVVLAHSVAPAMTEIRRIRGRSWSAESEPALLWADDSVYSLKMRLRASAMRDEIPEERSR